MRLKVVVCGALGKMGSESVRAIQGADDMDLVAQVDSTPGEDILSSLAEALDAARPDVCLDFTHPSAAAENVMHCLAAKVAVVIGTSGIDETAQARIRAAAQEHDTPALLAPNFAIGAILMMKFAEEAARWMPEAAVVELHHSGKADAPSGTAKHTARRMAAARAGFVPRTYREELVMPGALGASVEGVPVHSVRLPGLVAHQEVLFGSQGETLTIRHDSLDRTSFMPGVLLALRKVRSLKGLTVGLESLMFG